MTAGELHFAQAAARMQADVMLLLTYGGPVAVVLLALSVVALAMTLFKAWQFAVRRVGRHRTALHAIELWFAGQHGQAYEMVARHRSPLSRVVAQAMRGQQAQGGAVTDAVKEDATRVALEELRELRKVLRGIEAIAQLAPLLGLLGTVLGMIVAFSQLQASGAAVNPAELAGGIWTALVNTALGLAVAIVFSAAGAWFEARVENERSVIETTMTGFFARRSAEDQARGRADVAVIARGQGAYAH